MSSLFYPPKFASGLAGAKLTFTQTGTTTAQNTYTDEDLTIASSNPVVADASGVFAPIYLDPRLPAYRVKYTTSADVLIYQVDDYPSNQNTSTGSRIESTAPQILLYDTDGTANFRKFFWRATGDKSEMGFVNDAENSFTTLLTFESAGGLTRYLDLPSSTTINNGLTSVGVSYPIAGTFTGTLTGYASGPTGTVKYRIISGIANLYIDTAITGTSNATTLTMTGLPAALTPDVTRYTDGSIVTDNGTTTSHAICSINTSGVITLFLSGSSYSGTAWTNSGTKGLSAGWNISYPTYS